MVSINFKKILFLLPLILLGNTAYAEPAEIQMDWLIEGQLDQESVTTNESKLTSSYQELIAEEESEKIVYNKFVTNNQYAIGDYEISIHSEEGQMLNSMLIEQIALQEESFKHKIKYYDRFSDGYIEIAEALLEPIGEQRYLFNGRAYDYNPNSNLEFFLLERGHTLENLEAIPNNVFSPASLDEARQLIADSAKFGTEFDLNELSPNYMRLDESQAQQRMMDAITEQTSNIFNEILTGEKQIPEAVKSDIEIMIAQQQRDSRNIFDNFKLDKPQFENTGHVKDSLQGRISSPAFESPQSLEEFSILLLIPVIVGMALFGYLMRKKLFVRRTEEPLLEVQPQTQVDYAKLTKDMLSNSLNLYNENQRKEAFEILSQAIRFYYSKKFEINKELTNFELLSHLRKINLDEFEKVRSWLILCGSVEYAKYKSQDQDYRDALDSFTNYLK